MLYIIIGIMILGLVLLALKLSIVQVPAPSGVVSRPILTDNEREFFYRLCNALPPYHVFPQVSANALLKVNDGTPKQKYVTRNRFSQKHVDYVVCERETLRVIALIELDDRTHRAEKDNARDAMFKMAGYVTHRFQSRRKPTEAEIAMLFSPLSSVAVPLSEEQF